MIYLQIFLSFFKIGLFAIGGAYSFLPLIEKEVVVKYAWLTKQEFLDVAGIVKIFPGAISIKYATYVGYKIAKIPGAILANLANLLGPALLILFITTVYLKYKDLPQMKNAFSLIQIVIFAMIIAVAIQTITLSQLMNIKNIVIAISAFVLFLTTKIEPALIIIAAGILGIFLK
ncbi:MAG: chromate transporter [Candidatus Omnitrophota bacterium]